jgi:hypothetical protein
VAQENNGAKAKRRGIRQGRATVTIKRKRRLYRYGWLSKKMMQLSGFESGTSSNISKDGIYAKK